MHSLRHLLAALLSIVVAPAAFAQQKAGPGCDLANADIAAHGIRLGDASSAKRVLGSDVRTVIVDPMTELPWYLFASRDNKQLLALRHHPGDLEQAYREIEVKYGRHDRKPDRLHVWEFVTGRGIKLGATRRFVVGRLGPCFTTDTKEGVETIRYQLTDKAAPFLRLNKFESYYAEYEFRRGRLIRYRFGQMPAAARGQSMIPKSGSRRSDGIMLQQRDSRQVRFSAVESWDRRRALTIR